MASLPGAGISNHFRKMPIMAIVISVHWSHTIACLWKRE